MARPQNAFHTHETLDALAKRFDGCAKAIRAKANELKQAADDKSVSVAYQSTVDEGLQALNWLLADVQKKIDQKKFSEAVEPEKKPSRIKG